MTDHCNHCGGLGKLDPYQPAYHPRCRYCAGTGFDEGSREVFERRLADIEDDADREARVASCGCSFHVDDHKQCGSSLCECSTKECFGCQGLGYFFRFDLEGERIRDRDCLACNGTGRVPPRQIPQPGYWTDFSGSGPRRA